LYGEYSYFFAARLISAERERLYQSLCSDGVVRSAASRDKRYSALEAFSVSDNK
jgi:hypothetical protein